MYFSFDAMIALMLMTAALVIVFQGSPHVANTLDIQQGELEEADAAAESALQVTMQQPFDEALSAEDIAHYQEETLLEEEDLDKPVLDVIAVLWASNEEEAAQNLSRQVFGNLVPDRYDFSVTMDDDAQTVVYNTSNRTDDAAFIARGSRLVSGVARDKPTRGFIAQASLTEATKRDEEYVMFGGYVGDGNITVNVTLPDLDTVRNVTLEGEFGGAFNLSFNGNYVGSYTPTAENLSADVFHICSTEQNPSRCEQLVSGDNTVELLFPRQNQSSVGGGFLRVNYNRTTGLKEEGTTYLTKQKRLPGINGVINLFSSFYVPGTVHDVEAKLHYEGEKGTFSFSIGNATIYEQEVDGETTVTLDNSTIAGNLSQAGLTYDDLSAATTPFKAGMTRESMLTGEAGAIDAVATTDLSGSMSQHGKIDEAKAATKDFVDLVLDTSDARVGLTGFDDFIRSYMMLSTDRDALKNEIEGYKSGSGTCVGCGIIRSTNTLIMRPLERTILDRGGTWRYTTADVASDWTTQTYEDTDWESGTAPLGVGGKAYTQIGEDDVYRFRKTFDFDDDDYFQPYLYLHHAGNVTVYLNDEQIHQSRMSHAGNYWDTFIGAWQERSGMWHKTENRYTSDESSWYFGMEEEYRYATGEEENGSLVTHPMDLSNVTNTTLTYSHWLEVQKKDDMFVEVNDGTGWTVLERYQGTTNGWEQESINLSDYATDNVTVRFRFEAQGAKKKNDEEEGWYVDDVSVGGFDSDVLNRSLLNETNNVLAVELEPDPQPYVNGSETVSSFGSGEFVNTTETGSGVELVAGETNGTYDAAPISAGKMVDWTEAQVDATVPADTDISMQYGTNASGAWTYHDSVADVPNSRYIRFNATLSSDDVSDTPTLHAVRFNHSAYGASFDLKMTGDEMRTPSILVLSDGKSNQVTNMENVSDHTGDGSISATDHAIEAACRAYDKYRTRVYTVGYEKDADEQELKMVADCGNGEYYHASLGDLSEVYEAVTMDMLEATFEGQMIEILSGDINQTLYPDSYISFNYTSAAPETFGTFSLTQESDRFGGDVTSPKNGSFTVPDGVTVSDAKMTAYSSLYWADRLAVQNESGDFEYVYNLWGYDTGYDDLGDPFHIYIPPEHIQAGENMVQTDTALNRTDVYGGSPDNKVLYTAEVSGLVGYGDVYETSQGGTHTFDTVGGQVTLAVGNESDSWNPDGDAVDDAVNRLMTQLDVTNDGTIDFDLDEENMDISTQRTGGIEWLWGPATVSLEVWRDE